MPSPNIPTLDTAIVYPGTVLFEARTSRGPCTTRPFELVGAPNILAERFAAGLNRLGLEGVFFRPAVFEPTFHKHARVTCGGCQIHVLDSASASVRSPWAPRSLAAFRAADPDRFRWRDPPYEYEPRSSHSTSSPIRPRLREQIEAGTSVHDIARSWEPGIAAFRKTREKFLLY